MSRVARLSAQALVTIAFGVSLETAPGEESLPQLDRLRLLGKGYYENDDYKSAAAELRRVIELAPRSAPDRFNLALVLLRAQDLEESVKVLDEAEKLDPSLLAVHYLRGIILKNQGRFDKAIESLERVIAGDPACRGAFYNLGVCRKQLQEFPRAITAFKKAVELEPEHPSSHYQLITLYRRSGDVDAAERENEIYNRVKDTVDESEKTAEALERSKYSYIIEVPPEGKDLAPAASWEARFTDATAESGLAAVTGSGAGAGSSATAKPGTPPAPFPETVRASEYSEAEARRRYVPAVGGALALGDHDGDGDLDLYVVNCSASAGSSVNRLYRNDGGGRFADVTEKAGVGDRGLGMDAAFGDCDNDGDQDLYVVNCGPNVLYRNRGDGTFEDVSRGARADEPGFGSKGLWMDYDHDNDLDIIVGNFVDLGSPPAGKAEFRLPQDFPGQVNGLLRNSGSGTFSDRTDESGLLVECSQTRDLTLGDFDEDGDTDLLAINADNPSLFFANARMGKLQVGGKFSPPLEKGGRAVGQGDFNHDRHVDLAVATEEGVLVHLNDGRAGFTGAPVPLPERLSRAGVDRVEVFDFNDDGWSDLLVLGARGGSLALLGATGPGKFADVSAAAGLEKPWGDAADAAAADLDGDGDGDILLLARDRGPIFLRNDFLQGDPLKDGGPAKAHWVAVRLKGKKVNRGGYGATVEVAVGGHAQKQTAPEGRAHFGLGDRGELDLIRVTWPNGVSQNIIRPPVDREIVVEEYVKVSASCAFLYADGGKGFDLINEILGIGPLGVPRAAGKYHVPDCTELTLIGPGRLAPKDGSYELRLTEELREIAYVDRIALRVVDHPAALEIVPNEMFTAPPFPEDKFFAVKDPRPPRSAADDRGNDVLGLVSKRDGRHPEFPLTKYDGLARRHSLTLDLGDLSGAGRIHLFLDGWIYWADSSTVIAVSQDPRYEFEPLSLQVQCGDGRWVTAVESVGLPTSKGSIVPVDLSGKFPAKDWSVRLATNLCVYFDRIFVATGDEAASCRATELPASFADLHFRGFSSLRRDRLGFERFDYGDASASGSWSPPQGKFTRYGDVLPLLQRPDDMYAIFGPGDELTLRFDATRVPELPQGWSRSFVFFAVGWVKDGDLSTKFSETVAPLPFHGMSGYPYPAGEHYPDTPEHREYLETWNTRPMVPTLGPLLIRDAVARPR